MTTYSLTQPASAGDLTGLGAVFRRTGVPGWPVDVNQAPGVARMAELDPAVLRAAAQGWGGLLGQLPFRALDGGQRQLLSREELPAQAGWVRPTGEAVSRVVGLGRQLGVDGGHLVDLADRDPLLRSVAQWAGRAKDGAMDLRALTAAFGWFLVSLVLDALRQRVASLPPAEGQRLLGKFTPMMVLILQAQKEGQDGRVRQAGRRQVAVAEAEAAQLAARRAEVLRAYNAGEEVARADLLDLALASAQEEEEDPQAGLTASKSGRRKQGRGK